jgi:hypothetical protein
MYSVVAMAAYLSGVEYVSGTENRRIESHQGVRLWTLQIKMLLLWFALLLCAL